jgi:hypothetical protein
MEKKTIITAVASIIAIVILVCIITFSSCRRNSALDKEIKIALVKGDTTKAEYNKICDIIMKDQRAYSEYLNADKQINTDALAEHINEIGQSMRPPRTWNIKNYGSAALTLNLYLERSGSMTPYDAAQTSGELKKAINDLINSFPNKSEKNMVYIVNSSVYPYNKSLQDFMREKDIFAATAGIGDPKFTDFSQIFSDILKRQGSNAISILVTDMIYSPANTENENPQRIFNEEGSLATNVFKNYPGKAVIVVKLKGSFSGLYYPYNQKPQKYTGARPFYVFIIGDAENIDALYANASYSNFLNFQALTGFENFYVFNGKERGVNYTVVPEYKDNIGRFRSEKGESYCVHTLENCESDRDANVIQFTVAADLSTTHAEAAYLNNAKNYELTSSVKGCKITNIRPIEQGEVTGNSKMYLEGKTHLITIQCPLEQPEQNIKIALKNHFPDWIENSSSDNDTNIGSAEFGGTTFGLKYFLHGIYSACSATSVMPNYTTIEITLKK